MLSQNPSLAHRQPLSEPPFGLPRLKDLFDGRHTLSGFPLAEPIRRFTSGLKARRGLLRWCVRVAIVVGVAAVSALAGHTFPVLQAQLGLAGEADPFAAIGAAFSEATPEEGQTRTYATQAAYGSLDPLVPAIGHETTTGRRAQVGKGNAKQQRRTARRGRKKGGRHRRARRNGAAGFLEKDEIVAGVRAYVPSVASCLSEARSKGYISSGKFRLILAWVIRANGRVSEASLESPSELLRSPARACVVHKMANWSFPASGQATPVQNFPMAITVR